MNLNFETFDHLEHFSFHQQFDSTAGVFIQKHSNRFPTISSITCDSSDSEMRNLVVLGGSSHTDLVDRICHNMNIEPGDATLKKFSNGETSITIKDSVREKDVYVIQSGCGSVNDNFIELLVMISACKTASAKKVTAVLPLFPYSRQPDAPYGRKNGSSSSAAKKGLNGNLQSSYSGMIFLVFYALIFLVRNSRN